MADRPPGAVPIQPTKSGVKQPRRQRAKHAGFDQQTIQQTARSELGGEQKNLTLADLRRIELDLQARLAVAYRRHANARQEVNRYKDKILPRAKKSLELVTDG